MKKAFEFIKKWIYATIYVIRARKYYKQAMRKRMYADDALDYYDNCANTFNREMFNALDRDKVEKARDAFHAETCLYSLIAFGSIRNVVKKINYLKREDCLYGSDFVIYWKKESEDD